MAFDNKRFAELKDKVKAGTATDEEKAELQKMKQSGRKGRNPGGKSRHRGTDRSSGFHPGNDFAWWNKEPELLKDAANFKCNYIAGTAIAGSDISFVIPGVIRVLLRSVYGSDSRATDSINVWARELFLRMFQKYRPVTNYSASDLGISILAGCEVVKTIAKYERIYGVINRYSKLNVNMPNVEADALGLTAAQLTYLQGHLSDFRYDLNFLLKKAQRLCIPKDLSILQDAISLFGYEYLDHESGRSQIIVYDIDTFGIYSDTLLSGGGSIQFEPYGTNTQLFDFSADNMCELLSYQLDALLGSDSIQRIYADLVVWFGEAAMLQFLPVPEDYVVAPVYAEEMLHKMHNAETSSDRTDWLVSWADPNLSSADVGVVTNGYYHVYQCDDRIVTKGALTLAGGTHANETVDGGYVNCSSAGAPVILDTAHVLDTYRNAEDPAIVTEGVLFKYHATRRTVNGNSTAVIKSCAFYIPVSFTLYSNDPGASFTPEVNIYFNNIAGAALIAADLAIIDWAPLVYNLSTVNPAEVNYIFGDLDNVIVMYQNDISRIQRTIVLSGLKTDVPVVNK